MRKVMALITVFTTVLFLSGCDELFNNKGEGNLWYDTQTETLHVSWDLDEPEADADTGEVPSEVLYLQTRSLNSNEWEDIAVVDNYKEDNYELNIRFEEFGEQEFRVVAKDEEGNITRESNSYNLYVEKPEYLYWFNVWFDEWAGELRFEFDVNREIVSSVAFEKSSDGGNTWEFVVEYELIKDDWNNQVSVYETVEGTFVYRMVAYDELDANLGNMNAWNEISIKVNDEKFVGDPKIYHIDTWVDIWNQNVNIWWNSEGAYNEHVIQKSINNEDWETIATLPRVAQAYNYKEEVDGEYYYRVLAVDDLGETVYQMSSNETTRIKVGAVIGSMNSWIDWERKTATINWDMMSDEIGQITLERLNVNTEEVVLLGEFGNLKKMYEDIIQPGTYTYTLKAYNNDGVLVDEMTSNEIQLDPPNYLHYFNSNYDNWNGQVRFEFAAEQNKVSYVIIEKTKDGGLSYIEVLNEELIETNEYNLYFSYYELEEGTYSYRITLYDELDNVVGEQNSWGEINVDFSHLNFDEPTTIYNLDGNYDIYSKSVNLWWHTQGTYEFNMIEKSIDGVNWELVEKLPRISQGFRYNEEINGDYQYRISIISSADEVIDTYLLPRIIRVDETAILGNVNVWYEWNNSVNINWEVKESNSFYLVKVERKEETSETFTVLGEFGNLKRLYVDDNLLETGNYIYKITLFDEELNEIDSLETLPVYVEINE